MLRLSISEMWVTRSSLLGRRHLTACMEHYQLHSEGLDVFAAVFPAGGAMQLVQERGKHRRSVRSAQRKSDAQQLQEAFCTEQLTPTFRLKEELPAAAPPSDGLCQAVAAAPQQVSVCCSTDQ